MCRSLEDVRTTLQSLLQEATSSVKALHDASSGGHASLAATVTQLTSKLDSSANLAADVQAALARFDAALSAGVSSSTASAQALTGDLHAIRDALLTKEQSLNTLLSSLAATTAEGFAATQPLQPAVADVRQQVVELREAVVADRSRVDGIVAGISSLSGVADGTTGKLEELRQSLQRASDVEQQGLARLNDVVAGLSATVPKEVTSLVSSSMQQLSSKLDALASSSQAMREVEARLADAQRTRDAFQKQFEAAEAVRTNSGRERVAPAPLSLPRVCTCVCLWVDVGGHCVVVIVLVALTVSVVWGGVMGFRCCAFLVFWWWCRLCWRSQGN